MDIFLMQRTDDTAKKCDIFLAMVVIAKSYKDAISIHPNGRDFEEQKGVGTWVNDVKDIKVTILGSADLHLKSGIVLTDFKAG